MDHISETSVHSPDRSPLLIDQILSLQQNRFPNLFVDRVEDHRPGEMASCRKNFTYNEWFFPLHFPDEPIVPGFVLLETMTQALLVAILSDESLWGSKTNFLAIKACRFFAKVSPGDATISTARVERSRRGIVDGSVEMTVEDQKVASCSIQVGIPAQMPRLPREVDS